MVPRLVTTVAVRAPVVALAGGRPVNFSMPPVERVYVQLTLETVVAGALLVGSGAADWVADGVADGVAGAVLPAVVLSDVVGVALELGVGLGEGAAIGSLFDEKAPEPTKIAVVPRRTSTRSVAITPGEKGPFFF